MRGHNLKIICLQCLCTCFFLMLICLCPLLQAQETTGSISGTVHDPSGALIANANVIVRSPDAGSVRQVTTDSEGRWSVTTLPIGMYEVVIEKAGFKKAIKTGIVLNVNDHLAVNSSLDVGEVSETTTVTAEVPLLESDNAVLSGMVDSKKVTDLPLNGRNFAQLINLQAGTSTNSGGNQGSGQSVNGARGTGNNFLLDGGDLNDPVVPNGSAAAVTGSFTGTAPGINAVSIDAVEEFRVITSNANAEFGRNSGAQVNIITKSGTNTLHGTLFEFARNRVFDSRSYFDLNPLYTRNGHLIGPPLVQNNFGGVADGPIQRGKMFFLFSYEGFRQSQGISVVNNIPSPNTIAAVAQQNPVLGQILSSVFIGQYAVTPTSDNSIQNIITTGTPVLTPLSLNRSNNFSENAYLGKIDRNLPRNARISVRYAYFHNNAGPGTVSGSGLPGTGVGFTNTVHNGIISLTQPFGGAKLNDFRAVFERNSVNNIFDPAPQGVLDSGTFRTGAYAGQDYGSPFTPNGIPTLDLGFGLPELGYSTTAPNIRTSNTYQYSDTFTLIQGRSTLKIGGELRRIQDNSTFGFLERPNWQWNSTGADTILQPGTPASVFTQNLFLTPATSERGFRIWEGAPFVQETFKLSSKLTIDAGLRYEYLGRLTEVNGYLSNAFLAPDGNPVAGESLLANGPAGMNQVRLITVGSGRKLGIFQADLHNVAPRIGIAYVATPKITVRGSYGIFYDRIYDNVVGNARNSPPFVVPVTTGNTPYGLSINTADPYSTTLPIGPTTVNPNLQFPRTQRGNLSVQQQIGHSNLLEITYVVAKADHLVRTLNEDFGSAFPAAYRPANINVPTNIPNTNDDFRPLVLGNFSTRDTSSTSNYNSLQASLRRNFASGLAFQITYTYSHALDTGSGEILTGIPVASITNLLPVKNANGTVAYPTLANINALRQAQGLGVLGSDAEAAQYYAANYLGSAQLNAEYGNSDFDLRHAAVINFNYDLPFGAGKLLGESAHGLVDKLIGGWQANGILRFQTGSPYTLLAGTDVNGDGLSNDRTSLLSGSLASLRNPTFRQNGNLFLLTNPLNNGVRTLGISANPSLASSQLPRNDMFGPGVEDVDFSLFKNTSFSFFDKKLNTQFRAESFNLFNHTNFANPSSTVAATSTFGQITATTIPGRQVQLGLKILF